VLEIFKGELFLILPNGPVFVYLHGEAGALLTLVIESLYRRAIFKPHRNIFHKSARPTHLYRLKDAFRCCFHLS